MVDAIERHRDWIAGEALATTLEPFAGARAERDAEAATVAGEPIRVELSLAELRLSGTARRKTSRNPARSSSLSKNECSPVFS